MSWLTIAIAITFLAGCTTSQPVGNLQLCILASCNHSPVTDRVGNPSANDSEITEDIKQDNVSSQKGQTSADIPL
jgi:uncharacterized lipoprotein YajG